MPSIDSAPVTPRDYEIIALVNKIGACCVYQNHAVIVAALAQIFLYTIKDQKNLPVEMQVAASALNEVCQIVRALPQDAKQ